MSLEGKRRSRERIGETVHLTEILPFLLLPLFCGPFSRLWEVPCRATCLMIKMALGVEAYDGGAAAGVLGQSLVHRSQGVLTWPLYWTRLQIASWWSW